MNELKFSTVDLAYIKDYLRVDYDDDDVELQINLNSAKSIIREHFNKSDYQLDEIDYTVTLVSQIVAELYESKCSMIDNSVKENPIFKRLMDKNRVTIVG